MEICLGYNGGQLSQYRGESRARMVLLFFTMVSRKSLQALWFFLRKEESTGMLSGMRRGEDEMELSFDCGPPGDLILLSRKMGEQLQVIHNLSHAGAWST